MAGGIDWFRWHHGSVTDPKVQLVARKSKQALASVIAVWAFVLEQASASEERGTFGSIDEEAIDCLLDLEDGATGAILAAMGERGLVEDGFVSAWEKRQPKRERTDNTSTERSRSYRDRQRHATPETDGETPCNATQRQKTPRGEESREEKKNTPLPPTGADARFDVFWSAYPKKSGEDAARRAFAKRKANDALLAEMLAAIAEQAKSPQWVKDGGQYIPNPATWLNEGRWQDEPATNPTASGSDGDRPQWALDAGFPNRYEAENAMCWQHNAHQFRDGKRIGEVAA